jgi:hypothetical protein
VKRTAFKRPGIQVKAGKTVSLAFKSRPRAAIPVTSTSGLVLQFPKQVYLRDVAYLRWVASLPCAHCGVESRSQAAHSDDNGTGGKGIGIKSSDDTCYPACGPVVGDPGCHWRIGTSGMFDKAVRRELEQSYAAQTLALWDEKNKV